LIHPQTKDICHCDPSDRSGQESPEKATIGWQTEQSRTAAGKTAKMLRKLLERVKESNPRFCRNRPNHRKQAQKCAILSATGCRRMTLYDNRPTDFFSATKEFRGHPRAFSTATHPTAIGRSARPTAHDPSRASAPRHEAWSSWTSPPHPAKPLHPHARQVVPDGYDLSNEGTPSIG
jgi:hypothetical protein